MHEQELPSALAADVEVHFARVVEIYQDRLYAFVLRMVGNPQDAEDSLVDAFERAYQALGRYESDRIAALALRPWLYQITLNVVRNRMRGKRLQVVSLDSDATPPGLHLADEQVDSPDRALERRELQQMLARLVAELPERERGPVVLRHVQGYGYGEIATLLEQPVGTVKSNVHRGIRRLRDALGAYEEWR